jgi:hypothetical protein
MTPTKVAKGLSVSFLLPMLARPRFCKISMSKMKKLKRPIFIIGAARSGTTLIGDILKRHKDIAYWVEPKYIWRYRNASSSTDIRKGKEATLAVQKYIHSKFSNYVKQCKKKRFMEKTPSNCFRIPFIYKIFPDGLFLHIIRDGRDVAFSAQKKWSSPPDKTALWRRVISLEMPLRDAPYYAKDVIRDVIGRQFLPKKAFIWGPHFPGIRDTQKQYSTLETCAIQWRQSVNAVQEGLRGIPEKQQMALKFEELLATPEPLLRQVLNFFDLEPEQNVFDYALNTIDRTATRRWEQKEACKLKLIKPHIHDLLFELGYKR